MLPIDEVDHCRLALTSQEPDYAVVIGCVAFVVAVLIATVLYFRE